MADILDTRELQERLEELENDENRSEDEDAELKELTELSNDIPEWCDGNTLINHRYFEEYCEEMLKDCGDLPQEIPWYIEIDWEKTATNMEADYSTCDYQGETYFFRNC